MMSYQAGSGASGALSTSRLAGSNFQSVKAGLSGGCPQSRPVRGANFFHPQLFGKILCTCLTVLILTEKCAYAYGDPGSGAFVWQFALARFACGLFYLHRLIRWIRSRNGDRIPPKAGGNEPR